MERASDIERFFQCLTCCKIENCNLDEKAEDKRGMCTEYSLDYELKKKVTEKCGKYQDKKTQRIERWNR